jgi:hypothetical protein
LEAGGFRVDRVGRGHTTLSPRTGYLRLERGSEFSELSAGGPYNLDPGPVRGRSASLPAPTRPYSPSLLLDMFGDPAHQAALADSWLTRDEEQRPVPAGGFGERGQDLIQFASATDDRPGLLAGRPAQTIDGLAGRSCRRRTRSGGSRRG